MKIIILILSFLNSKLQEECCREFWWFCFLTANASFIKVLLSVTRWTLTRMHPIDRPFPVNR